MTLHDHHAFTPAPAAPLGAEIAAFLATLRPNDPLYWPALAAADGCDASLAELNGMLGAADCFTFDAAATSYSQAQVGMPGVGNV